MEEVEYVVPPGAVSPKSPKSSNKPVLPPRKPSKTIAWVKSHKIQTIAGLVMVCIVLLFGTLMITGKQLTIGGFGLNPMVNQAACLRMSPTGCMDNSDSEIEPPDPSEDSIAISGTLPDGNTSVQYSHALGLSGTPALPCVWSLDSISPRISGATLTATPGTNGTTGTFSARPLRNGPHTVNTRVVCQNNQIATRTITWNVILGSSTAPLDITGTFASGTVGRAYSASVQTVNANGANCNFNAATTPNIPGAAIVEIINVAQTPETSAEFSATPIAAGTFTARISVICDPTSGESVSRNAQKDFTFVVNPTSGGGGGGGGTTTASSCSTNRSDLTPIYRFWNLAAGDHFYTTNANEIPAGYQAEGITGYVYRTPVSGTVPIYRSYSPANIAHYYSTTNNATEYGYNNEGIIGYAFTGSATGATPWFRLHKGYPISDYLETISAQEKTAAMGMGYADEGTVANICERNT